MFYNDLRNSILHILFYNSNTIWLWSENIIEIVRFLSKKMLFDNIVWEMAPILSSGRWVKLLQSALRKGGRSGDK